MEGPIVGCHFALIEFLRKGRSDTGFAYQSCYEKILGDYNYEQCKIVEKAIDDVPQDEQSMARLRFAIAKRVLEAERLEQSGQTDEFKSHIEVTAKMAVSFKLDDEIVQQIRDLASQTATN